MANSTTVKPHLTPVAENGAVRLGGDVDSSRYVGSFAVPGGEGRVFLEKGCAHDYASMRAAQLTSLLSVIHGDGGDSFRGYGDHIQDNVLWLASNLADEVEATLELLAAGARKGAAA